jgi:hypothetical protein
MFMIHRQRDHMVTSVSHLVAISIRYNVVAAYAMLLLWLWQLSSALQMISFIS